MNKDFIKDRNLVFNQRFNTIIRNKLFNGLVIIIVLSLYSFEYKKTTNQSKKPNIIFILTDDHRWDALGVMGNSIIKTPNLDKLAKQGVLFKNARVTTSICCVSRASILTGQYQSKHKINDFVTDFSDIAFNETYPMLLKKEGYNIGCIGKFGVGVKQYPDLYNYWAVSDVEQPSYLLFNRQGKEVHQTDSVAQDIKLFLNQFANIEKPFYLSVNFKAPHEVDGYPPTYIVQERFKDLYNSINIPKPLTASPEYWEKFPDFFKTENNIARQRWRGLLSTPTLFQENVKNYYRLITGVDEVVGKLNSQLKDLGIQDNTIIIFSSDNGFALGEHGLQGKWFGNEESIRVPLIIYDPRLPENKRGQVSEIMALNIDMAPTILHLGGTKVPSHIQGYNLYDILNQNKKSRKTFFYEHTYLGSPTLPKVEGVVTPKYKYMLFTEHNYEQLYNIKQDKYERENLATNKEYTSTLKRMRKKYEEAKKLATK